METVRQIVRDNRNQTAIREERDVLHPGDGKLGQRTECIEFKNLEKEKS